MKTPVKKNSLYICGPMSGFKNFNYESFMYAESVLQKMGFDAVNPARYDILNERHEWKWYLLRDIKLMIKSKVNGLVLLKGFQHSKGAAVEIFIAKVVLGIPLYKLIKIKGKASLQLYNPKNIMWKLTKDETMEMDI